MEHRERMQRIKEHFNNISIERFEENLKNCKYGKINSPSEYGFKLKASFDSIEKGD